MLSLNVCDKNEGTEARNKTKLQRYSAKMVVCDHHLQTKKAAENNGDPPPLYCMKLLAIKEEGL